MVLSGMLINGICICMYVYSQLSTININPMSLFILAPPWFLGSQRCVNVLEVFSISGARSWYFLGSVFGLWLVFRFFRKGEAAKDFFVYANILGHHSLAITGVHPVLLDACKANKYDDNIYVSHRISWYHMIPTYIYLHIHLYVCTHTQYFQYVQLM